MYSKLAICSLLILAGFGLAQSQTNRPCTFSGAPKEQARCLLRHVKPFANVDPAPITLPQLLDQLIGEPTNTTISKDVLGRYLSSHNIREDEVGGAISKPVSNTSEGQPAAYFIIHDTSSPTLERTDTFPPEGMDTESWPGNKLKQYLEPTSCKAKKLNPRAKCEPVAHVFINRVGQSGTGHDFSQGWRSTQYEGQTVKRRGLFLGVENIQPRRKNRNGIDVEAPNPGFTDAQLDRLALVYVVASVRRGQWLIPAFHGVIDLKVGSHDDPQNFDLNRWTDRLNALLQSMQ